MTGLGVPNGYHGNALTSKGSETLGSSDHIAYLDRTALLGYGLLTHKEIRMFLFDYHASFPGGSLLEKVQRSELF